MIEKIILYILSSMYVMDSPLKLVSSGYDILRHQGAREFGSSAIDYLAEKTILQWKARNKNSLTVTCDGVTVTFDTSSDVAKVWFYPRYLDGSLHEPAMTRELLAALDSETVFYDVGALMGYYSVFASSICTRGEVHSFELDSRFVEAIEQSLARNDSEASVIQNAVSDSSGRTVSYGGDVGITSISSDDSETSGKVETLALDDYVDSHTLPDVMKIDIEGFEYQALCGAEETLESGHPETLFLEVHPSMMQNYDDAVVDLLELLDRYGYSYTTMTNHRGQVPTHDALSATEIEQLGNTVLLCHSEGD